MPILIIQSNLRAYLEDKGFTLNLTEDSIANQLSGMESPEQRQEKYLKKKRLLKRLRGATTRVKDVEQERIWALVKAHTVDEGEVIRWCIGWLEQLARGERVVVNLRAESDPRTAYVGVARPWVLRVLKRIAANLDQLSGYLTPTEESNTRVDQSKAGGKRRLRLAEPEPEMSSLSHREQRAILREKMGLPPM